MKLKAIFISWPIVLLNIGLMFAVSITLDNCGRPVLAVVSGAFFFIIYLAQLVVTVMDI